MRVLALLLLPIGITACSDDPVDTPQPDAAVDSSADAGSDGGPPGPVAKLQPGVALVSVPQAVADQTTIFRLADGTVVVALFPDVRPTTGSFPWTASDGSAADAFLAQAKTLQAGAKIALPPSRWLRADLPRSYAADLPPASCTLAGPPKCVEDPTTGTVHVPPEEIPKFDNQTRTFMGPNVSGLLLDLSKVTIDVNASGKSTIYFFGTSSSLAGTFATLDVPTTAHPDADGDGYVKIHEPLSYDFSGRVLFSEGPVTLKMKSGHITATPSFKAHLDMADLKVNAAELLVRGTMDARAEMELTVATPVQGFKRNFNVVLYEREAPLPPMVVAGIPIPQAIKAIVYAECSLDASAIATMTAGATLQESIVVGGRYTSAGFTNASAVATPTLSAIPPTFSVQGTGSATCAVASHFSLLYFGFIGPYVEFAAAASLQASYASPGPLKWGLGGAFVAGAGFESVKIPGLGPVSNFIATSIPNQPTIFYTKSYSLGSGG